MIFFSADLHLFHLNIIQYCNRPFSSIEEMHAVIVEKWNKKVNKTDTVYCLGDFCWGKNISDYLEIRSKLNGDIYLITGDHDKLFDNNSTGLIGKTPLLNLNYKGQPITLCHWCMRTWARSHFNAWHCYAHSHGRLPSIGKSHDVGVDSNNFEPLSFDEIVEIMKNKPDNPNLIKKRESCP